MNKTYPGNVKDRRPEHVARSVAKQVTCMHEPGFDHLNYQRRKRKRKDFQNKTCLFRVIQNSKCGVKYLEVLVFVKKFCNQSCGLHQAKSTAVLTCGASVQCRTHWTISYVPIRYVRSYLLLGKSGTGKSGSSL